MFFCFEDKYSSFKREGYVMIDGHLGDNLSLFVHEISCTCTLGYIRGCPAPFIACEPKRDHPAHIFILPSLYISIQPTLAMNKDRR